MANTIDAWLIPIIGQILGAILAILVGRWLAKTMRSVLRGALQRTNITTSLIDLFSTITYYGILFFAVLSALAILGVPVATLVGSVSIVAVFLGIALRESLGNLAAAVIFLLFQPFKIGELIESSGVSGTVQEIQLFNTVLVTNDNKLAVLPNAKIQENSLINHSRRGKLRADVRVAISYDSDLLAAKRVLEEMLKNDARVLPDPQARVVVTELGEIGVQLTVMPFVSFADYGVFQADWREQIKLQFDAAGIAFAQRESQKAEK